MRKLMAIAAVAVMMTAFVGAQRGKPASPLGTAATEVGGKYDAKAAEPSYQGGKWIEITYGRPIKRGRKLFSGEGDKYGKVVNPDAPVWRAGADTFVAGNAIFGAADPRAEIGELRRICSETV